jgi:DNA-binding MurR/RpiR family transcriptional regulator
MEPSLKNRSITTLKQLALGDAPQIAKAAKHILDHQGDFALAPIRETARRARVSTNTLVRLAQQAGFESYDALRAPFRHALLVQRGEQPDWLAAQGTVLAQAAGNTLDTVTHTLRRQNPARLEQAVALLLGAGQVYVSAVRASHALAYFFEYVGRMALKNLTLVPRHMGQTIDDLAGIGAGDVLFAITFTPYSRETIEACRFAQARDAKLVLLSDSEVAMPGLEPDVTLVAAQLSTHHFGSYAGAMALLDVLLAMLVEAAGEEAAKRIASYEALRREHAAYWTEKKTSVPRDRPTTTA